MIFIADRVYLGGANYTRNPTSLSVETEEAGSAIASLSGKLMVDGGTRGAGYADTLERKIVAVPWSGVANKVDDRQLSFLANVAGVIRACFFGLYVTEVFTGDGVTTTFSLSRRLGVRTVPAAYCPGASQVTAEAAYPIYVDELTSTLSDGSPVYTNRAEGGVWDFGAANSTLNVQPLTWDSAPTGFRVSYVPYQWFRRRDITESFEPLNKVRALVLEEWFV